MHSIYKVLFFTLFLSACSITPDHIRPKILGVRIVGQPILVFDHLKDKIEPDHIPDIPIVAWKESNGSININVTHYENYRMRGADLEHLTVDLKKIFSSKLSASDIVESDYNYHHWISTPYTLDGKTIYSLVHTEWYACLLNNDCAIPHQSDPSNNQASSKSNTISLFKSVDGGASWIPNGLNEAHVVAKEGFYWTGSSAFSSKIYQKAINHSGLMTPSRIIKEGDYYYSIGLNLHRDFNNIDLSTNQAPIDQFGYVLMRTKDISQSSGWEAWVTGSLYSPISEHRYTTFKPIMNGTQLHSSQLQIIFDENVHQYIAIFALYGKHGPIYYMTTNSLSNPSWSEANIVKGSKTFTIDPRSKNYDAPCNNGFSDRNYISLIDSDSSGFNFEFTNGDPWLFYVVNPAKCGGHNLDRDIYRTQLKIDYTE